MTTRCGFVALMGAPNAGKSTLLNRLTGAKLSIVSPKAQTTRFRVLGILMQDNAQVLLVDTPGIFKPKRKLDRAMVNAAWTGAEDADLMVLIVDAKVGMRDNVREIAQPVSQRGGRAWLVLNKTDLIALMEPVLLTQSRDAWMAALTKVGVPCAPVNNIAELVATEQLAAMDMMRVLPGSGLDVVGLPLSFDRQRPHPTRDSPKLGEHNAELFGTS